jgi:hypothetical protein
MLPNLNDFGGCMITFDTGPSLLGPDFLGGEFLDCNIDEPS